jgi:putative transposase
MELRERAVAAVEQEGMSRQAAARRFAVAPSTVISWVKQFRTKGHIEPGRMGGHKPKALSGEHRIWLLERCKSGDFTLRGLVGEIAAQRGPQGRLPLGLGLRAYRGLELQKTYGPPRLQGVCRDCLISLLQRIRPRGAASGHDGDTRAPVLIKLPASDRAVF